MAVNEAAGVAAAGVEGVGVDEVDADGHKRAHVTGCNQTTDGGICEAAVE